MMNSKAKVLIFSGAGLSVESGLSTYRDADGIWQSYDMGQVCNEYTWQENFEEMHAFYNELRADLAIKEPNEGHKAIARIQQALGEQVEVITQNVDDLLERAGCTDVLHVHGELTQMECRSCGHEWAVEYDPWHVSEDACPHCQSQDQVRPNIVFFGGKADNYLEMYDAFDEVKHSSEGFIVVVGTSGTVIPVNELMRGSKATSILCNLHESEGLNEYAFNILMREKASKGMARCEAMILKKFGSKP